MARLVKVLLSLALAGCVQSPTNTALKKQWHKLTDQQHASFDSPADAMTLAPTPDTGAPFATDATHDCSSCPPR